MDLISVIIPVYNVEKYLHKCIKSIITQTYHDLEIILVDDGSTDKSGKICDEYAQIDPRVVVIHQNNQGQSVARNRGIDIAKGKWIAFVDSDDFIDETMYEVLLNNAIKSKADISSCDLVYYRKDNNALTSNQEEILEFEFDDMVKGLLNQRYVRFEVWNKLWKKEIIGEIRFKAGQISEEVYFDRMVFPKANKMVHTTSKLYYYRIDRPGNTKSRFRATRMCVFDELDKFISSFSEEKEELANIVACIAASFCVSMYCEVKGTEYEKAISPILISSFNKYYEKAIKCKNGNYKMLYVFKWFPRLYPYILRFRKDKRL